jgi:hypothetical protein
MRRTEKLTDDYADDRQDHCDVHTGHDRRESIATHLAESQAVFKHLPVNARADRGSQNNIYKNWKEIDQSNDHNFRSDTEAEPNNKHRRDSNFWNRLQRHDMGVTIRSTNGTNATKTPINIPQHNAIRKPATISVRE